MKTVDVWSVKLSIPSCMYMLVYFVSISAFFMTGCTSADMRGTLNDIKKPDVKLKPTRRVGEFTSRSPNSLSTIQVPKSRRVFTTSTTTTVRPLTEEEQVLERYCLLLVTSCEAIGLSGTWFDDMMRSFHGKETLRSSLTLLNRITKQTLIQHVEAGIRVPNCGLTRTLAALTVMRDLHGDSSKRDVSVFMARKIVGDDTNRLCDTRLYELLDGKVAASVTRETIHRIHLHVVMFASLYPEVPSVIYGILQQRLGVLSEEFLIGLDRVVWSELNEGILNYPRYSIDLLRLQISAL